jgi:pimeloyl-ACP methyl ester carboxylesterase
MSLKFFSTAILTVAVLACSSDAHLAAPADDAESVLAASRVKLPFGQVRGRLGPGALYEILVPPGWNRSLILYAHGYVDPGEPVRLVTDNPEAAAEKALIEGLVGSGYAVAHSSFSENGLAVKDGAQRTEQLRGIFVSRVGRPDETILVGSSLGGLVVVDLAERHPNLYAGALALCGFLGGTQTEIDYLAHVRVLFDAYYRDAIEASLPPGVHFGDLLNLPPAEIRDDLLLAVAGALQANPAGVLAIQAAMANIGQPLQGDLLEPETFAASVYTAVEFSFTRWEDVLARTHGRSPFDNTDTNYGMTPPVDRFSATPDARNYVRKYYETTGALQIPVVSVHNPQDPVAPSFHQQLYALKVESAGAAGRYIIAPTNPLDPSRTAPFGHCEFGLGGDVFDAFALLLTAIGSS